MATAAPLMRLSAQPDGWSGAVDHFLSERALSLGSRRIYRLTLERVGIILGDPDVTEVTERDLVAALTEAYPTASPASWNRHVATLRSFYSFATRQGWTVGDPTRALERRREVVHHDRALTRDQVEAIFNDKSLTVRDQALFRLLYESAARANEVLCLNIEDLDRAKKRATTRRKGGDLDVIHWQTGTARLLPHVVGTRKRGPLFLADQPPNQTRAPASTDIDPDTGHARLSYRRAAEIFKDVSGGATLHSLRHSAISHLAEEGVPLPLLMAKSRHESLKTLQRYARPSVEAVAALTAAHDSARRR